MKNLWIRLVLVTVLVASVLIDVNPSPRTAVIAAGPDGRFGVVEAYAAPNAATALGAGWTRVTFEWNRIQPNSPDEWNVTPISDQVLANELAQGRQVVGLLITTPGWATDVGIGPGVPQGLYLPTDDPNNRWATFVRTIVTRYAGRIDHWTIWNEPEIPSGSPDMTWGGSIEDFIQLLRVAYVVANQVNPNAVIHLPAVTHWHNEHWFGQFLDSLVADPHAAGNNYYFDVATLHLYHEPEKIYDITTHYYRLLHNRGMYKPFWIAETNAYLSRISEDEQAFLIIHAFSLEIAAGAQRIAVYKMADTATDQAADPEPFGLVRMDGSRRPAFTAYQVATNYLSGFRGGTWDRRDEISLVTIDRGTKTTTVVWSRSPEPQTAIVAARTTHALVVDTWGTSAYVYPDHGYYFVDLPGASCNPECIGAPLMLVEDVPVDTSTAPLVASPTSAAVEAMDPNVTPDPNLLPTPTPTFTPTPTPTPTRTPTPTPTPIDTPTPTVTPTPPDTPTPTVTPTPPDTPTPTPIPVPTSDVPSARPWLLIGVLALAMGGTAIAADIGSRRPATPPRVRPRRVPRRERRRPARPLSHVLAGIRERWAMLGPVAGFVLLMILMLVAVVVTRGSLALVK
jgi:hypothetical protein